MDIKMIRRVDELGRVCIPKEFRRELELVCGDKVEVCMNGNKGIILKPADPMAGETRMKVLISDILEQLKAHSELTVEQVVDIIKDEYEKHEEFKFI